MSDKLTVGGLRVVGLREVEGGSGVLDVVLSDRSSNGMEIRVVVQRGAFDLRGTYEMTLRRDGDREE